MHKKENSLLVDLIQFFLPYGHAICIVFEQRLSYILFHLVKSLKHQRVSSHVVFNSNPVQIKNVRMRRKPLLAG